MAVDQARVKIDGDAGGLKGAAKEGQKALQGLGKTTDAESKKLGLYGEKLGKAFGPGEGLHGRLDNLEMPLRDTEGAFARAQSAIVAFGNDGATATDKISAGFLLAGDSIASFVSGGAIGLAIAAGVAGIALLTGTISEEAEETKKAEEATKDYADALDALAKSAVAANVSIAVKRAEAAKVGAVTEARIAEDRMKASGREFNILQEQHSEWIDKREALQAKRQNKEANAANREAIAIGKRMALIEAQYDGFRAEWKKAGGSIKKLNADLQREMAISEQSWITQLLNGITTKTEAVTKAVDKSMRARGESFDELMSRAAKSDKERTEAQQALRKEDEGFDKRLTKKKAERLKAARLRHIADSKLFAEGLTEREDAEKEAAKTAESLQAKRVADFKKAHSVELAGVNAMISGLETMAHEGTLSLEALADATITAAGKELTAKGTVHLMAGLANMAATFGAHGGPEAAQGAAMIAAGIGMGAIGGAIGRSGAAPSSSQSTPTDTRNTRAAATSSSAGDGGPVVINFNGPAYDRAGVSQIINSGMRRARHRRLAGA